MLPLEEARQKVLDSIRPLGTERVALNAAFEHVLSEPIVAPLDLPLFDNSAMDGYAVRAEDVAPAKIDAPVRLRLQGRIQAGQSAPLEIQPGCCARIFTGSRLPRGANAVVMQEDTRREHVEPGLVWILDSVSAWENVRRQGEDVKAGQGLFASGDVLSVGAIALLSALGLSEVMCRRAPAVALLSTGNELIEAGQPLVPGAVYECNRRMLAPLVTRAGARPRFFPIVRDDMGATCSALEQAFAECDVVVSTGGVSVGEMDLVKDAFERIGGQMQFWKVAIRPGKPFMVGRYREKLLFGLPGNPVSAFVTFLLLVRPALRQMQGTTDVDLPVQSGTLALAVENRADRRHFMRVRQDEEGLVHPTGLQGSHVLSSLVKANGLLDVPPGARWPADTPVRVLRWD